MKKTEYAAIEAYMLQCMKDSAHDKDHVYRVLYNAMAIAAGEGGVNMDVLIAACLLHDIARPDQMVNPKLCHAQLGAERAWAFLTGRGWAPDQAEHVRQCIRTHRFRKGEPPVTLEAKILYDADKLDVTGAIGAARTLQYNGAMDEPIYTTDDNGDICDGSGDDEPDSFFREYRYKLARVYDRFTTQTGAAMAAQRQAAAERFYQDVLHEVRDTLALGRETLSGAIE